MNLAPVKAEYTAIAPSVTILEYKEMEPFFVAGDSDVS
jgi:hypothetical protein